MDMIYDLVLNFSNIDEYCEFYEWNRKDKLTYIKKMPVLKVTSFQLNDFINNKVKIKKDLLKKIFNQTITKDGIIEYALLLTDSNKVIAIVFNEKGESQMISSLLFDEEDAVILEVSDLLISDVSYELKEKINHNYFLTRYEKMIQNKLLGEIRNLYKRREYDEINYLYNEIGSYSIDLDISKKYNYLIEEITNNFSDNLYCLYDIIKLTQNN